MKWSDPKHADPDHSQHIRTSKEESTLDIRIDNLEEISSTYVDAGFNMIQYDSFIYAGYSQGSGNACVGTECPKLSMTRTLTAGRRSRMHATILRRFCWTSIICGARTLNNYGSSDCILSFHSISKRLERGSSCAKFLLWLDIGVGRDERIFIGCSWLVGLQSSSETTGKKWCVIKIITWWMLTSFKSVQCQAHYL